MPYFTLHRNYVLRTTKGHAISFVKGERAWVPPACVPDAVAIGAQPEDQTEGDVLGEDKAAPVPMTHDERQKKLYEAFNTLLSRNQRGDFTASGLPHNRKLEELCGFDVTNKERDEAWMAFSQAGENE